MLTEEIISGIPVLKDLTPEQKAAIVETSKNDETSVIAKTIGGLHGQYDTDVLTTSGIAKKEGEKSYDYTKRVIEALKVKAEGTKEINSQLEALKAEKLDLENKIKAGSQDETLKQQLNDATAQVKQMQAALTEKETTLAQQKTEFDSKLKDFKFDAEFGKAVSGIKFKPGMDDKEIREALLENAKAQVKAMGTPEFINKNGEDVLVIRDKDGNVLYNPQNNLKEYTLSELLTTKTALAKAIDAGREGAGAGTGANPQGKGAGSLINIASAKTQVEADEMISKYLGEQGISSIDPAYSAKSLEIRQENKVGELPIK